MAFFQAMEGIFSVMIMVAVGYLLAGRGWFDAACTRMIPRLVNLVAIPMLIIWNFTSAFDRAKLLALAYGLLVPFLSMLLCCLLGYLTARVLKVAPNRRGVFCTIFFCSNTVFIGIPVSMALFGDIGTPFVMLYIVVNAFFFWTLGNYLISTDGKMAEVKLFSVASFKNVLSPPFIAFMVAVALILLNISLPDFATATAKYLGGMTTPLSLLYIGVVLFGIDIRALRFNKDVIAILAGRFIAAPLLVLLVASVFPIPPLMRKVFVIQSAMPPMMLVAIIAKVYDADSEYATSLTAISTLAAAIAIPIYMVIL
ncbi:MAG: AEC family transporter [Negativicutes bacterium]|nr:AEC family transporter [Negativicutes bacterium]